MRESNNLAWSLTPNDVDGLIILPRKDTQYVPMILANIELPRLPTYRGGLLLLSHDGEAVMRNGIEIDNAEKICTIPSKTVVFAIERRLNASNIARYKIIYNNHVGWISERMRGSTEELMLIRYTSATVDEISELTSQAILEAQSMRMSDRLQWVEVDTIQEALLYWESKVVELGYQPLLTLYKNNMNIPHSIKVHTNGELTFSTYFQLASTTDGHQPWLVEQDMQLSELLSKIAHKHGVQPYNLPIDILKKSLLIYDSNNNYNTTNNINNPYMNITSLDSNRIIARASILRVANRLLSHSLPYFSNSLPEDLWRFQCTGVSSDIDIISNNYSDMNTTVSSPFMKLPISATNIMNTPKIISSTCSTATTTATTNINDSHSVTISSKPLPNSWYPPCIARKLHSLRRLLFNQTKTDFFELVLDATTTFTPLHQDEYEDPREIPTISINRVKATSAKLSLINNINDRVKQSLFGQLKDSMKKWSDASFRRSYLGMYICIYVVSLLSFSYDMLDSK